MALRGLRVERIDWLLFSGGIRKRRLNQVLSVPSLSLGFWSSFVVLLNYYYLLRIKMEHKTYITLIQNTRKGPRLGLGHFVLIIVLCLLAVVVRMAAPVQVIDWKDSSPK